MATDAQGRLLSEDGNYYWDGSDWQLVDTAGGTSSHQSATQSQDAQGRLLSEDGVYYWDGSNWQLVDNFGAGQSTQSADTGSAANSSSVNWPTSYPGDTDDVAPGQSPQGQAADLDRNFQGWLAEGNYTEAAEALNGFNIDDIDARLAQLTPEQIAELHQGAVSNPHLGRMSQVALATGVDSESDGLSWWQKNESTVWDIAIGKGLVVLGEQVGAKKFPEAIGGKLGGIIGWAIDFAISSGGDTSLPHAVFQAAVSPEGIPIPVVIDGQVVPWHRKRENAERDAQEYADRTGEQTMIDEEYSKDPDDPD